ncbi:MAG: hypothetical protein KDB07_12930, partial [Planctomycetes bacterium]|nr:hypothetical protein [Planctomycetota bacterium]
MRHFVFACFLGLAGLSAVNAPVMLAEEAKPEAAEKLPANDAEAEAMLKAAWARIESAGTLEKDAVARLAADSETRVDYSDVPSGYKVSKWGKAASEGVVVKAKVAWVAHEEAFSAHVLDEKKEGEEKEDWRGFGLKRGLGGAQIKSLHAMPYLLGMRDFATEFKDNTFTFAEAPHKDWKEVVAWYHFKGKKFSSRYLIDDKGKGFVRHLVKRERLFSFMLSKPKKKMSLIEGLTIQPASALA